MKESNFISFIGYVGLDDEDGVMQFVESITRYADAYYKQYEIILACDNASADRHDRVLKLLNSTRVNSQITVLFLKHSVGKNKSLVAAMDMAIGDYVVEFDSLLFVPSDEVLLDLYYRCMNGYDACILTKNKRTIGDKIYNRIIKRYGYVNVDEYRDDGLVSVLSRRMINRTNSIKRQVTNKWFYYKISGLPCQYIESNELCKSHDSRSDRTRMRMNTVFVFTSLVHRFFSWIVVAMFIMSLLIMIVGKALMLGCVVLSLSFVLLSIVCTMKKQSLSLEYLWSKSNYQFSGIEKIGK